MTANKRKTNDDDECVFKRLIDKEIDACSYMHTQQPCLIERKTKKFKDGKKIIIMSMHIYIYIQSPGCSGHDRLMRNQLSIQLKKF
jgi:hypothetical protein